MLAPLQKEGELFPVFFKLIDTFPTINLASHYVIKAFVNNIVSEVNNIVIKMWVWRHSPQMLTEPFGDVKEEEKKVLIVNANV